MAKSIILDLCGGTGAWSKPYKEAGYKVHVITLPKYDVTKVEFSAHAITFIRQDKHYHDALTVLYEDVFGILAAPPCTEFSLAKGGAPRDFSGAMEVVDACLKIIWECRIHSPFKFWALENPVGFLRQFIGKPAFTFEQWQFGGDKVKPTDIWGYFNLPQRTVETRPPGITTNIGRRSHSLDWSKLTPPKEYDFLNTLPYAQKRAAIRAITPPGFAQAFYRANSQRLPVGKCV